MPKWLRYEYLFFCISYKSNPGTTWNKHTSNCINGVLSIYYIPLIIKHGCSKPQLRRSQSNVLPTCCFRLRKEASNGCATGGVRKSPLFAQIFSIWINFSFKWTARGSCLCPINFFLLRVKIICLLTIFLRLFFALKYHVFSDHSFALYTSHLKFFVSSRY